MLLSILPEVPKTSGSDDHNPAASSPSEIRKGETGVCSFWFMFRNSMLWHSIIFKTVCTGGLATRLLVSFQTYIFFPLHAVFFWHCAILMFHITHHRNISDLFFVERLSNIFKSWGRNIQSSETTHTSFQRTVFYAITCAFSACCL